MSKLLAEIILPQATESVLRDECWVVRHTGPVLRTRTPGETGLYNFRVLFESVGMDRTAILDRANRPPISPRLTHIEVPLALLAHMPVGSVWQDLRRVSSLTMERRRFNGSIDEHDFSTVSGAEILDRHFRADGNILGWSIEANSHGALRRIGGEDFVNSRFLEVRSAPGEGGPAPVTAYVPCLTAFSSLYYVSDRIAASLLNGLLDDLYTPARTCWREEGIFSIDSRFLHSIAEKAAVAGLICSERGRNVALNIRASVQTQAATGLPIHLSSSWPVAGRYSFRAEGQLLPSARSAAFLVSRVLAFDARRPFYLLEYFENAAMDETVAGDKTASRVRRIAAAAIRPGSVLAPNTSEDGSNRQESSLLPQRNLASAWLRKGQFRTASLKRPPRAATVTRRPGQPAPVSDKFSAAPIGSSSSGIPKANQFLSEDSYPTEAALKALKSSADNIARRFGIYTERLTEKNYAVRLLLETAEAIAAQEEASARERSWLRLECQGLVRARRIYAALVRRSYQEGPSCLIVDFERSERENPPHHFYVFGPRADLSEADFLGAVVRTLNTTGGNAKRSTLQCRRVEEQLYEGKHGTDRSKWVAQGWGEDKPSHHAFKTAEAVNTLLREWRKKNAAGQAEDTRSA